MNRYLKTTAVAGLVLALGAAALPAAANAGGYRHNHGAAAAAGLFGFAAGAVVGSTLSTPRYYAPRPYYAPRTYYAPRPYYDPSPVYYAKPAPWSPAWYRYCSAKHRSFNPNTGYFLGYDGRHHFCR